MTREELLTAALETVTKHRETSYGTPEDNFSRIAAYWTVHLGDRLSSALTPADVAYMMVLLKVARGAHSPSHPDHWLDIAGYAACGSEVSNEQGA